MSYNYEMFPSDDDMQFFPGFFEHLKPGEAAPDPQLMDLESGITQSLTAVTRQHTLTVIEVGSLT